MIHTVPHTILYEHENPGTPEATVCVSLFNYEHFIGGALESVAKQTLETFDLIVVDDQSRDHSVNVAERWIRKLASRFRRARLVQHCENSGLAAARNTGFSLCDTELVFVLDADNLVYPRCLARLRDALEAACDAAFAYSIIETFGSESKLIGITPWSQEILAHGNYIDAMAMIRKPAWEAVGGYANLHPMGWEDFDLWCKLAEQGYYGVHVPEILARYRVHRASMLRTITNQGENATNVQRAIKMRHPWVFPDLDLSDVVENASS